MRPRSFVLMLYGLVILCLGCSLPFIPNRQPSRQPVFEPLSGEQPPPSSSMYASLHVNTEPQGGQVYLDERLVGLTPLQLTNLQPRSYSVFITLTGYKNREALITLYPGKKRRLDFLIEPLEKPKNKSAAN